MPQPDPPTPDQAAVLVTAACAQDAMWASLVWRLGHGGGGATTLRVYAAWVPASDRRAAEVLGARMPARRPGQAEPT